MLNCKGLKNKIWAAVLGMILVLLLVPQTLQAAEHSLEIIYEYEGTAIEGAVFDIYKIAEVSEEVQIDEIEITDDMLPTDSGVTDEQGIVTFPNECTELESGIYYVVGQDCEYEGVVYRCAPFLVSLSNDVAAYPKSVTLEEFIDVTVTKIWEDDNNADDKRTDEVTVNLLLDGEVSDAVILSEENDWTYRWEDLSGLEEWDVEEADVPEGYEASVESEMTDDNTLEFEIINTYEKEVTRPSKLPQTGMLNWPIPVLAGTGLVFFMIGWGKRQKDER